jgi:thiamine pyrophosphokinase
MSGTLLVGAAPSTAPGAVKFYGLLLADADAVVAADAAGEWCADMGRVPDLVVGDFDSARSGAADRLREAGAEIITHPAAKDASDLDLAMRAAFARFGGPVTITAAFVARPDHTLAAMGTLIRAGAGARAVEPGWSAQVARPGEPIALELAAGAVFSVLAPAGADGVTIAGARWELSGAALAPLSSRGVSNESLGQTVWVSCYRGALLVIVIAR